MQNNNKNVVISIRINSEDKKWINKNRINAGILFRHALWKAKNDEQILNEIKMEEYVEKENSGKSVFAVCSMCGVVHFTNKCDLDKNKRKCKRCESK